MSVVTLKGLASWQRRLGAKGADDAMRQSLRRSADALASEAERAAPMTIAASVEVMDVSRGAQPAFRIGTASPAGYFAEFGTVRKPGAPWLLPAFRARLGAVKDGLRKAVLASFGKPDNAL